MLRLCALDDKGLMPLWGPVMGKHVPGSISALRHYATDLGLPGALVAPAPETAGAGPDTGTATPESSALSALSAEAATMRSPLSCCPTAGALAPVPAQRGRPEGCGTY